MKWWRNSSSKVLLGLAVTGVAFAVFASGQQSAMAESGKKAKLRENSYYYSAFNKRDPFRSLIVGEFVSEKKMSPIDLARVELVGLVKGELDRFALLEDNKGFAYILRVGDRIKNGSVVAIGDKTMVARVTNFGQSRKFTLRLAERAEGDKK
ncbi:MAG: pilus assembly protein PilP [Candidatus Krumholzibacteria bacterium]|nr:pilus assembly protein PilP [Candidatus Krumholzibacteria bacterium]